MAPLRYTAVAPLSAPLRVTLLHAANSASRRLAAARCFAAAAPLRYCHSTVALVKALLIGVGNLVCSMRPCWERKLINIFPCPCALILLEQFCSF